MILLDVDTTGKLTQIFPDAAMMERASVDSSNHIRPGRALTIPQLGTPSAGFEFVAQPPSGLAMLVAVLSDKPVQIVSLGATDNDIVNMAALAAYNIGG